MNIIVHPSSIKGQVHIPSSKSYMQRVLVASLLAEGTSVIKNPGKSEDEMNLLRVIGSLGAESQDQNNILHIKGGFRPAISNLDIGESGLGIRLIIPVTALSDNTITITGKGSLTKRPMGIIEKALSEAGAECNTKEGYLPVRVKGPLRGGKIHLDGSISSQFLSGLLFALPLAEKNSIIEVKGLKSKPYVDMTLEVLEQFGITIINHNYEVFEIPGKQQYKPAEIEIEGDWSNAAFFFTGAAIRGKLEISGLNPDSRQGDRKVLEAIEACGASMNYKNGTYSIKNPSRLQPFSFDATDSPDLFPPLSVLAACCNGTSTIRGLHRLQYKESNRAEAIMKELAKVNIKALPDNQDKLKIKGGKPSGGSFYSHHDHRMAMAGAIMALAAREPIEIINAEAVGKSFPTFFETIKKLNVKLEYQS
jgi:3-phosphoshikimate 1-carboxyvinyltransferase